VCCEAERSDASSRKALRHVGDAGVAGSRGGWAQFEHTVVRASAADAAAELKPVARSQNGRREVGVRRADVQPARIPCARAQPGAESAPSRESDSVGDLAI
jgi:hypothetical protein